LNHAVIVPIKAMNRMTGWILTPESE